jgi:hypothetical protein
MVRRLVAKYHRKLAIEGGQQWTIPSGGDIDKILRLGEQRIKLSVESYYNAIRPQAGNQNWLVQVTVTLLFPHD